MGSWRNGSADALQVTLQNYCSHINKYVNKKIESNIEFINKCISEQKPIDWISRNIGVARDTFRKYFPDYKGNSGFNVDRVAYTGSFKTEKRLCARARCNKEFTVSGNENTKTFKKHKFCSIACSKARDHYWDRNASHYTTICWRFHKKECIICGEDKIVAVHHYDENHYNNSPDNLVPMCPTHHQYIHSKHKHLVIDVVDQYVNNFKGAWDCTGWSSHLQ